MADNVFLQLFADKDKTKKAYPNAFLKKIWTDKLHNLANMIHDNDGTKLTIGNASEYTDIQFKTSGKNGNAKLSDLALNSDLTNKADKSALDNKADKSALDNKEHENTAMYDFINSSSLAQGVSMDYEWTASSKAPSTSYHGWTYVYFKVANIEYSHALAFNYTTGEVWHYTVRAKKWYKVSI